ncbi:SDR family NAD(P)-dependent oxidoreductase [Rhizobium favelukesii]|uniref:SDR family NAD(P)-dependent oxidoreductase n=1 Tax=Rhizobium favelukesii TaxID=348824 RepID=UPI00040933BE|nr:SDR family oxidoreductase [Rhizobium favelukesii]
MPNETRANSASKIAIVTGGSRGLGRNTAINLARRGVNVIFTYRANRAEAEAAVSEIKALGVDAIALQLDTGHIADFDAFVGKVKDTLQGLGRSEFDYLVNNAGSSYHAAIVETTEEAFDELVNVHLKGVYFLTQKLLSLMADGGRIINISSGLARFAVPGISAYASIKGAVEVFTRYLAKELGPRGITANTVAPGAIATDFSGGMVRDNPTYNKMVADATALGRAGVPDDVGPMIASLLSEDNRWVNGQRIEVSGGTYL